MKHRNQLLGQPTKAYAEITESIVRNDNRAVFRSRMQLDSDQGARTANLADVYLDLGLKQQAIQKADAAKRLGPNEFMPYKIMADIRAQEAHSSRASASEYLQAQLRQPLTSLPVRSVLAESALAVLPGSGPSQLGVSEYNSLTTKNENNILVSTALSNDDTAAYDVMVSGLYGRHSYLFESYSSQSPRELKAKYPEYKVRTLFYQTKPNNSINLFMDVKTVDENVSQPEEYEINSLYLFNTEKDLFRLGGSLAVNKNLSVYSTLRYASMDITELTFSAVPQIFPDLPPYYLTAKTFVTNDNELQLLASWKSDSILGKIGAQYSSSDTTGAEYQGPLETIYSPFSSLPSTDLSGDNEFIRNFASIAYDLNSMASFDIGIAVITFDDELYFQREFKATNSRVGIQLRPLSWMNVDLVYFEDFAPPSYLTQTLDKTHVFSVNQLVDERPASESEVLAVNMEARGAKWNFYLDALDRAVDIPLRNSSKLWEFYERRSKLGVSRVVSNFTFGLTADISSVDLKGDWGIREPTELDTKALPLSISWFGENGFQFGVKLSKVLQRSVAQSSDEELNESFTTIDFSMAYKLIGTVGKSLSLSIDVKNLTDEELTFHRANSIHTSAEVRTNYTSERLVVGRVTWLY